MRYALIPWIAVSVVAVASGEVTVPCPHETPAVTAEAIETITRDITLSSKARAESLESMTGSIILQRDSRVTRDVETGNGMLVLEPGSEVAGDLSNDTGTIRIDGARVGGQCPRPTATFTSERSRESTAASWCTSATSSVSRSAT